MSRKKRIDHRKMSWVIRRRAVGSSGFFDAQINSQRCVQFEEIAQTHWSHIENVWKRWFKPTIINVIRYLAFSIKHYMTTTDLQLRSETYVELNYEILKMIFFSENFMRPYFLTEDPLFALAYFKTQEYVFKPGPNFSGWRVSSKMNGVRFRRTHLHRAWKLTFFYQDDRKDFLWQPRWLKWHYVGPQWLIHDTTTSERYRDEILQLFNRLFRDIVGYCLMFGIKLLCGYALCDETTYSATYYEASVPISKTIRDTGKLSITKLYRNDY